MSASPDLEASQPSQRSETDPIRRPRPQFHLISGILSSIRRPRQQCRLCSRSRNRERRGRGPAATTSKYSHPSAAYWKLYMSEAKINDEKFIRSLKGDTDSMVFLNTLFSAIVASFIIEIYKTLLPDRSQQTNDLLSQLVSQSSTSRSPSPANLDDQSFHPPSIAIRINIVLFISFLLSVMSAVGCALIQQWCHEYMKNAYPRGAPHECGHIRTYLYRGLTHFRMKRFMYGTHALLHISVFLFFWALSDFFYTIHPVVGAVSRYCLVASLVVYVVLSIFPLIFANSPYNTPLTHLLGSSVIYPFHLYRKAQWFLNGWKDPSERSQIPYTKRIRFDRARIIAERAEEQATNLESAAIKWLFKENDLSDNDMDKFLEGLPGYISSNQTETEEHQLGNCIAADFILGRIREHFLTCATSLELSEEDSISRVLRCVKSLRLLFQHGFKPNQTPSEADKGRLQRQRTYVEDIIKDFETLCTKKNSIVALRASCVRALAVQGLLTDLAQSEGGTIPNRSFPHPLIPLFTFFFPKDNNGIIQQVREGHTPNDEENEETKKMCQWKALLSDGPLINLTKLAEAVRSREDAPPSSLTFCWKALERLVKQLSIAFADVSEETERQFNSVRDSTKVYVETTERGFRISPLLDILDVVIRGRRLALAFSSHPGYHNRADLVFGEEHLRNADLLESFARCLPDYITSIPEKRRKYMEDMVYKDHLWISLQVNLWNAQRSDRLTSDKLRVFEDCVTVLDVALSSLEGSTEVDWRAPEFGSLSHRFESFITHCFKDSFMGRATSFRVGMIKVRCYKVLLAQFLRDFHHDIIFRSQWDIASLTRLFCGLGIGDKKDAKIWKSYVNGGHIRPEFTAKAHETIDRAECDGPLLVFYKLGHLATTAVPLDGSGLDTKDLEKVSKLMENMIENEGPALNRASVQVWEKLGRLQAEVTHLRDNLKMSSEDRDRLQSLLKIIDRSKALNSSSSEHASAEGAGTPTSPLRKQRGSISRSSFSSDTTAVTGGQPGATPTSEAKVGESSADTYFDLEKTFSFYDEPPIIGTIPLSVLPVEPYFSYTGDTDQSRAPPNDPHLRQSASGSGLGSTWPSLATRMGSTLAKPHRTVTLPNIPPDPVISSAHRPSDVSDPGQFGTSPSRNLEVGEDE